MPQTYTRRERETISRAFSLVDSCAERAGRPDRMAECFRMARGPRGAGGINPSAARAIVLEQVATGFSQPDAPLSAFADCAPWAVLARALGAHLASDSYFTTWLAAVPTGGPGRTLPDLCAQAYKAHRVAQKRRIERIGEGL